MDNLIGFINIHKEKGYTSHDVVNIIRRTLGGVKTGHTGTLDPEATGVLPICIGKATKLSENIASDIKEYIAELSLGTKTTTYDHTGDTVSSSEVTSTKEEIERAIYSFKGNITQVPPMYSAIKVGGKKLYDLARQGKEIELKGRNITIHEIEILEFKFFNKVVIRILCSKGTYIRSLCNDIGEKLGCGGHMSALERVRTGQFYIKDSIKIGDFKDVVSNNRLLDILIPVEHIYSDYKRVTISDDANKYLYNGNKISKNYILNNAYIDNDEQVLVYDTKKVLIGLYQEYGECIKPITVFL